MFLLKLWSYLMGYISVSVEGSSLEKFINLATSRGIYLWDISRVGQNRFVAKVRLSGFRGLRHVGKRVDCRIKINQKSGAPFLISRVKRRRMLLAGALLFLIAIYGFSSVVWFIDIKGAKHVTQAKLLEDMAQVGLTHGAPKWKLDSTVIEKYLLDQNPRLAWAGVEVRGARVVVEVRERKVVDEDPQGKQTAHIVAKKKGLIKEVLVLAGRPVVKEGDNVEKGQVLISGLVYDAALPGASMLMLPEDSPESMYNKPIRAGGMVRARTWYEGYGEAQLEEQGWRSTGLRMEQLSIKIGSKEIIVKGPQKPPYQRFEHKTEVKTLSLWRNIRIPVEVIKTEYRQIGHFQVQRTSEQARQLAVQKALNKMKGHLEADAKLIERKVTDLPSEDGNLVRVNLKVEAIEDIGQVQLFKP